MRKERINEIWGVIFLLLGLFTIASLIFFDPEDLSFYSSEPHLPPWNRTGVIGAHLAHFLTLSFGLGTYLIPGFFLVWSWCFFTQRLPERKIFKLLGLVIGLMAASAFLGISFYSETRFLRAGAVGYVLGSRLLRYFGPLGSYIIAGSCFLLATLLATDFLIVPVLKGAWKNVMAFWRGFLERVRRFLEWWGELRIRFHRPAPEKETVRKTKEPLIEIKEKDKAIQEERSKVTGPKIIVGVQPVIASEAKQSDALRHPEGRRPEGSQRSFASLRTTSGTLSRNDGEGPERLQTREKRVKPSGEYQLPTLDLLKKPEPAVIHSEDLRHHSRVVEETLGEFGIEARVVEVEQGPVITRYELLPAPGVKVNRILSLGDDLALALKATSLRFIAPIPGKSAIGIEVPNTKSGLVSLRELLEAREFRNGNLALPLTIGKDTSGKPLIADLTQMPHLLIAGTTGSGKTVCVNSIIAGLLYHSPPDRLKFVMVDPKMVELAVYGQIPHMLAPVVTDPKKAAATLGWVVTEMDNRYRLFASRGVRNIQAFNAQSEEALPYIVVVIDELADLMMVAQDKVEGAITRLAQLSRAVGIHLLLATQRPSVDVITGVIKANFPARISFKVASKVDSRTVLDMNGADKLLGKGDLLFLQPGESKLIRGQGALVVDEEIARIVEFVARQKAPEYHPEIDSLYEEKGRNYDQEKDELFEEAVRVVLETGVASASTLQRRLRLGYTRAARIIDQMEAEGMVGPHRGSKPRDILIDRAQALRQAA